MTDQPAPPPAPEEPPNRVRSPQAKTAYPTRYFRHLVEQVAVLMKLPPEAVIEALAISALDEPPMPNIDDVTWAFNTWRPAKESKHSE